MDTTHQRERRQRYTLAFKRRVVEETLTGRESVSVVARRHDLNANLVFNWRRRYEHGALSEAADSPTSLLPIRVTVTPGEEALAKRPNGIAELELLLASGHRVRVHGAVDPAMLRVALEVLSR